MHALFEQQMAVVTKALVNSTPSAASRLTREEAARYKAVREQAAEELPELTARHHQRMAALDQLDELLRQLKAAREERGRACPT